MATISLRLPDDILREADRHARKLKVSRAEYVRRAISALNELVTRAERRRRLLEVSRRVRGESMRVNAEFDAIDDAPDA
jgi:metal-responsive CopG/Arc/MetJ family transcriptional regulator